MITSRLEFALILFNLPNNLEMCNSIMSVSVYIESRSMACRKLEEYYSIINFSDTGGISELEFCSAF